MSVSDSRAPHPRPSSRDFGQHLANNTGGVVALEVIPVDETEAGYDHPCYHIVARVLMAYYKGPPLPPSTPKGNVEERMFRVIRSLRQLQQINALRVLRNPFVVLFPLPRESIALSNEGIDHVIAYLFAYFAAADTSGVQQQLLWGCLTNRDNELFQSKLNDALAIAEADSLSGRGDVFRKRKKDIMGKTALRPPVQDPKPHEISDLMIETGMSERAFFSLDRINGCVTQVLHFTRVANAKELCEAWQAAASKAYALRKSQMDLAAGAKDVAVALRELQHCGLFWPWTREAVLQSHADRRSQLAKPISLRLAHYVQRASNNWIEVNRIESSAFGHDLALATSLVKGAHSARMFTAGVASECALHFGAAHNTRPLAELQDAVIALLAKGRGFVESEALERIDDEVTAIHDEADAAVHTFEATSKQALAAAMAQWSKAFAEAHASQLLYLKSTILLLEDFNRTLQEDPLTDLEDLPIFVLHDPHSAPQQSSTTGDGNKSAPQQDVWIRVSGKGAGFGDRFRGSTSNPFDIGDASASSPTKSAKKRDGSQTPATGTDDTEMGALFKTTSVATANTTSSTFDDTNANTRLARPKHAQRPWKEENDDPFSFW